MPELHPPQIQPRHTPLTPEALSAAYTLALRFGHHWATSNELADVIAARNQDGIARLSLLTDPGPMGGLMAPNVDEDGDLFHVTATGQLTWTVLPDGEVGLCVCRPSLTGRMDHDLDPGTRAIAVNVSAHGCAQLTLGAQPVTDEAPYGSRHVQAMHKALSALVGDEQASAVLAPCAPFAQDFDAGEGDDFLRTVEDGLRRVSPAQKAAVLERLTALIQAAHHAGPPLNP